MSRKRRQGEWKSKRAESLWTLEYEVVDTGGSGIGVKVCVIGLDRLDSDSLPSLSSCFICTAVSTSQSCISPIGLFYTMNSFCLCDVQ